MVDCVRCKCLVVCVKLFVLIIVIKLCSNIRLIIGKFIEFYFII